MAGITHDDPENGAQEAMLIADETYTTIREATPEEHAQAKIERDEKRLGEIEGALPALWRAYDAMANVWVDGGAEHLRKVIQTLLFERAEIERSRSQTD
jgi:hypothetical protein